ncbi:carotenoid oxygenase family protein [Actinomadura rupiterrae]|uniref:carotenoid oxygenase family protein n=1 Tax=Actinomadura rupiterrae TaxID=559627 RepID=UPI0020A50545|nr:carotenoid oxygenase family protein [Actinomadura rupiterrae]MCP2334975.1 carotenoid cleavage dioxygenase [Actinomadura rupiterrae]
MESWLDGHRAPVPDETTAHDLPVKGVLPAELTGRYLRNGPNPKPGEPSAHWFTGHGMVHGIRLRDGRAEWYRNRWVRTSRFTEGARYLRDDLSLDLTAVAANTHVIAHDGTVYALVENGLPHALTPDLDTVGPCDFGGRLTTAMTAHPKRDPHTGDLLFFGYGAVPPYLTYHRLSADGRHLESREVAVAGPTMMHDFAITDRYVVWLDLPMVFDMDLLGRGMPYRWDGSYGARIGVMPREGATRAVRWFDVDPCYVFHVGNAHEDDQGRVVLTGVRYDEAEIASLWSDIGGAPSAAKAPSEASVAPYLHRWTFDLATGRVHEEKLDDLAVEFPTLDDDRVGRANRYLYTVTKAAVVKHDLLTGSATSHQMDGHVGEAVFVPAEGRRDEDDGWLLTIETHLDGAALVVLAAGDLSETARVILPRRVPVGFHGSWIPDGVVR